jgi:hypothetical protein
MRVRIGFGNLGVKRARFSMSHLADAHCFGSHVFLLILRPLSISSTSETIAHQAAGCDVLQRIHRADKRTAHDYSLLLFFGFYLVRTTFFVWCIFFYVIFSCHCTQDVSDLRPGPFMHELPWHLCNRRLTNFTDQKQTHLLSVVEEK